MTTYNKPLPEPSPVTEEFWKAAKNHELLIQRCRSCHKHIFYPRELCPHCLSTSLEWVKAIGRGKVYSYTVVRQAFHRGFSNDVPYVIAIVELAEGPRLFSNVIGCKPEEVRIDMPVTAAFDDVTPDISLIKFRPVPV